MKILVTEAIHEEGMRILKRTGEVILASAPDEETLVREGKEADAILVRVAKITPRIIEALPNLKAVAKHGIGTDNIDVKCCTEKGVLVLNAPKSNTNAVAEHTVALVLGISKNLVFMDRLTRAGKFRERNTYPTEELAGKTVGFLGMGNIATLVAKKLSAMDMKVLAYDPYKTESEIGTLVKTAEEIYRQADYISLHTPLTEGTRHMVSKEAFSQMKPNAFLINASRGGTVDEKALYEALVTKQIRGAAFDVFEQEPPEAGEPLFSLDNVIVSPHNAALTDQALINMASHAAIGICDCLEGKRPEWIVNREVLDQK